MDDASVDEATDSVVPVTLAPAEVSVASRVLTSERRYTVDRRTELHAEESIGATRNPKVETWSTVRDTLIV